MPFEFDFAKSSDGETTEEIQVFLEESVKDGCEGLMVKSLQSNESFYEPSRRSVNWLKVSGAVSTRSPSADDHLGSSRRIILLGLAIPLTLWS